jgi:DNA polymerase IV
MSREDKELEDKVAYFKDQELLDISNDETGFPDAGLLAAEREFAFADAKPMAPPRLVRQSSSFLGPTPRERQAEFEAQARRQRAQTRERGVALVRSVTAPERDVSSSFPSTAPDTKRTPKKSLERQTLKRNASLSDLPETGHVQKEIPFYRQSGVVPRELKSGKHVKPADNIKLDPPHKQLLKGKVICMPTLNSLIFAKADLHRFLSQQ